MTIMFENADAVLAGYASRLRDIDTPEVGSRAGRVAELTNQHFAVRYPLEREILNPARKANVVAQIAETMWVLAGRNDIEWLSHYLPRASDFSDDGETWRAGYGPRLRAWPSDHGMVDQLAEVVKLLSEDRMTRRAVISIYDPSRDTGVSSKDIPCNNWLSFSCRNGQLDLHVATRSNDLVWGWSGINQFEWSVLLEIVAGLVGVHVGEIYYAVTSLHAYDRHWARLPLIKEAHSEIRPSFDLADPPRFEARNALALPAEDRTAELDALIERWFRLEYDIRTGSPLVTGYVDEFPEPMLRSWLRILQWWWSAGDRSYIKPLQGTRLYEAAMVGVQPKRPDAPTKTWAQLAAGPLFPRPPVETISEPHSDFVRFVTELHREKDAAYGDSWKKRGELVAILANIARKVDRLDTGKDTSDETSADTAIDLFVYLAKYRWWLWQNGASWPLDMAMQPFSEVDGPNLIIGETARQGRGQYQDVTNEDLVGGLHNLFDEVFTLATGKDPHSEKVSLVNMMLRDSYQLAQRLWHAEKNATQRWNPEA